MQQGYINIILPTNVLKNARLVRIDSRVEARQTGSRGLRVR
ncbi:hypothetical protein OROMI_027469 [Orobanche minor]